MKKLSPLILTIFILAGCGDIFNEDDEGNATHNPGTNCRDCHGFTYAGTVYSTGVSTTGLSGVTVTIHDAGGNIVLTSNSTGNFFTYAGSPASGFTVTVSAGNASETKGLSVTNGGCSASSCHIPGKQGRIYVNAPA